MKGLTTCLWFEHQAEAAARFYTSLFKHSKVTGMTRYGDAGANASGQPKGSVMTVEFEMLGQKFLGLNGGPAFHFTEAVSLIAYCEDQEEIDKYWGQLSAGGSTGVCGWLKDRYGLSWQITPTVLPKLLADQDPVKAERVMAAMLKMTKLDIEELKRAGEEAEMLR
ncbi:MAG TPA: VOC family protein [Gemmatimonadales bacterium]|nr:VOC family protein [Gemmatimonadales bacterium]